MLHNFNPSARTILNPHLYGLTIFYLLLKAYLSHPRIATRPESTGLCVCLVQWCVVFAALGLSSCLISQVSLVGC